MSARFWDLKRWQKFLLVYAGLLALSHLTIWAIGNAEEQNPKTEQEVSVSVVSADQTTTDGQVQIPYTDTYSGDEKNPPVLVMLPGGPGGAEVFHPLAQKVSANYRVIIPHVPGLGESVDDLPDYSFRTLGTYTAQFLDKLQLPKVHLL